MFGAPWKPPGYGAEEWTPFAPVVRITGVDQNSAAGQQAIGNFTGLIMSFWLGQRQNCDVAGVMNYRKTVTYPQGTITFTKNQGMELLEVDMAPVAVVAPASKLGSTWLIGSTDDTDYPFDWFGDTITTPGALQQMREVLPPSDFTGFDDSEPHANPKWGTAIMSVPLAGKQYWEAEIVTLPSKVPGDLTQTLSGIDDGSLYMTPVSIGNPARNTNTWPNDIDTFVEPIIGVVPVLGEPITWSGASNTRSIHKQMMSVITGPGEPRAIGAVLLSVGKGPTTTTTWFTGGYYSNTVGVVSELDPTFNDTYICGPNPVTERDPYLPPPTPDPKVWYRDDLVGNGPYIYRVVTGHGNPFSLPDDTIVSSNGLAPAEGPTFSQETYDALGAAASAATNNVTTVTAETIATLTANCIEAAITAGTYTIATAGACATGASAAAPSDPAVVAAQAAADAAGAAFQAIYTQGQVEWERPIECGGGGTDQLPGVSYVWVRSGFRTTHDTADYGDVWGPYLKLTPIYGRHACVFMGGYKFIDHIALTYPTQSNPDLSKALWTNVDLGDLQVGDIVQVAADATHGLVWFGKNGKWIAPGGDTADPHAGTGYAAQMDAATYYAAVSYRFGKIGVRLRFGASQKYAPPSGFTALVETPDLTIPT